MEVDNIVIDFEVEIFINTNNFFENYYKNDHSFAKQINKAFFSEDGGLTGERTECVEIEAQPPSSSSMAMTTAEEESKKEFHKGGEISC